MLNQSYAFTQFQNKFSKNKTLSQAIELVQANVDTNVKVEIVIPLISWDMSSDHFNHIHAMLFTTLHMHGEKYEAKKRVNIEAQGVLGFEEAFLKALKEGIANSRRTMDKISLP